MSIDSLKELQYPLFDLTPEESGFLRHAGICRGICHQARENGGHRDLADKIGAAIGTNRYIDDYMEEHCPDAAPLIRSNPAAVRAEWVRQLLERHDQQLNPDSEEEPKIDRLYVGPAIHKRTGTPCILTPFTDAAFRDRYRPMTGDEWRKYVEGKPAVPKKGQLIAVRDFGEHDWRFIPFKELLQSRGGERAVTYCGLVQPSCHQWRHPTTEEWAGLMAGTVYPEPVVEKLLVALDAAISHIGGSDRGLPASLLDLHRDAINSLEQAGFEL